MRNEVGKGRAVYFSVVEFDGALPEGKPYFAISNRFWKRPKNWAEIVEGLRWAAREEIPLRVMGPEYVVANLVEQPGRRILHLVNYNAAGNSDGQGLVQHAARRPTQKSHAVFTR